MVPQGIKRSSSSFTASGHMLLMALHCERHQLRGFSATVSLWKLLCRQSPVSLPCVYVAGARLCQLEAASAPWHCFAAEAV